MNCDSFSDIITSTTTTSSLMITSSRVGPTSTMTSHTSSSSASPVSSTSSATTSTATSASHVSTSSSHLLLLFSNNLINPHSCKFNFIRWSGYLQQFLCCKFFAILDYDYFSSCLLLQCLDNLPTLANDPGHQVSRNHHLKVATSSLHSHISSHSP